MNMEIKKYADSGDIKALKYIFVDSLDVDPTFVRYEDEYNYCKSIPGLLESHVELTPFKKNKVDWDEEYWTNLKMDLIKNFSDKRMSHMREVAKVFLADKVQRILAERASNDTVRPARTPVAESARTDNTESITTPATEATEKQPAVSKAEMQARQIEEDKRRLEAENKAIEAKRAREDRERAERMEQQSRVRSQAQYQNGGGSSKKAIGIAVAAVIVAVILILLLK